MTNINFANLITARPKKSTEFQAGVYLMDVDYVKPTTAASGSFMYAILLRSLDGPTKGRKVKYHVSVDQTNPVSIGYFLDKLADLGVTPNYLSTNPPVNDVAAKIAYQGTLRVTLRMRRFNGREVPDVVKVEVQLAPQPQG